MVFLFRRAARDNPEPRLFYLGFIGKLLSMFNLNKKESGNLQKTFHADKNSKFF